jgi:hypothetical protein
MLGQDLSQFLCHFFLVNFRFDFSLLFSYFILWLYFNLLNVQISKALLHDLDILDLLHIKLLHDCPKLPQNPLNSSLLQFLKNEVITKIFFSMSFQNFRS